MEMAPQNQVNCCCECAHKTAPGMHKCYVARGYKYALLAWLFGCKPRIVYPLTQACDRFQRAQTQNQR